MELGKEGDEFSFGPVEMEGPVGRASAQNI